MTNIADVADVTNTVGRENQAQNFNQKQKEKQVKKKKLSEALRRNLARRKITHFSRDQDL
jgi:hypothetical protein